MSLPGDPEYLFCRSRPDGQHVDVLPLLFGAGRIMLSADDRHYWVLDEWEYEHRRDALIAAEAFAQSYDPEPQGWTRHHPTGRRRPGGDSREEYVER